MSEPGAPSLQRYPSTADTVPPTAGAWCSTCFGHSLVDRATRAEGQAVRQVPSARLVRVLVTRVMFGPGKLNGVALARMVRVKRPDTKVVFIAREEFAPHAEGLGVFLPRPLDPTALAEVVGRLLVEPSRCSSFSRQPTAKAVSTQAHGTIHPASSPCLTTTRSSSRPGNRGIDSFSFSDVVRQPGVGHWRPVTVPARDGVSCAARTAGSYLCPPHCRFRFATFRPCRWRCFGASRPERDCL